MRLERGLLLLLAACKGGALDSAAEAPFLLDPPLLEDLDPSEGRFEGNIVAAPTTLTRTGEPVEFLTYNGLLPGPMLRVNQGDEVLVHFENQLPAGDWPSGIHWHGIEGYNAADGTPLTERAVEPGQSTDYRFRATRPGTFWYHPHVRGAQGLFSGLYAPLVVVDPDEATLVAQGILPADERVLVLSDTWTAQGIVTSAEVEDAMEIMNGTEGRSLLVNGLEQPVMEVVAGSAVRLRLINSSITRFWRLSVPGQTLYRVGGEGGLLDAVRVEGGAAVAERIDPETGESLGEASVELGYSRGELLLAPGERADVVLVTDGEVGEEWTLEWVDFARGRHDMRVEGDEMVVVDAADDGGRPAVPIATIRLGAGEATGFSIAEGDPLLTALGRSVGHLDDTGALVWLGEDGTTLDESMEHSQDESGNWVMSTWFGMNGEAWHPDHMGGPEQAEAPTAKHASLGQVITWEVRNNSRMAHPYHLHGFSFQPYALVYWPDPEGTGDDTLRLSLPYDEWEDTVMLPAWSSVYFRVELSDPAGDGSAAGRWAQHCHILQHGENGMMSELVVSP